MKVFGVFIASLVCYMVVILNTVDSALPFGIFPFLTSGWYYKPNPTENVIFGLIVVKVLAVRLASILGILPIPYHLNDLFVRSLGKRSLPDSLSNINLTLPHTIDTKKHLSSPLKPNFIRILVNGSFVEVNSTELKVMLSLLQEVKRQDTNDCFLKALCSLSSTGRRYEKLDHGNRLLISTVNYLSSMEKQMNNQLLYGNSSITHVFQEAVHIGLDCGQYHTCSRCDTKYPKCRLKKYELKFDSMLV